MEDVKTISVYLLSIIILGCAQEIGRMKFENRIDSSPRSPSYKPQSSYPKLRSVK